MDKVRHIKEDILKLISDNFGTLVAKTFLEAYSESTLPIFTAAAQKILEGLIGKEKTRVSFHEIFIRYAMEYTYV